MRFFDTNILVYAATKQDARKQKIAIGLLRHALEVNHDGCISSQVVNEFAGIMLSKLKMPTEVDRYCGGTTSKSDVCVFTSNAPRKTP